MQIITHGGQKNKMFSSERKILSMRKAQMVMMGMLNPHIQSTGESPPPPSPSSRLGRELPCIAPNRPEGTLKATFGFSFFNSSRLVGSGSTTGTGGGAGSGASYQGAMRKGAL